MLHISRLELCQYSSQTFSITSETVTEEYWNHKYNRIDTYAKYRLSVIDELTKVVVEISEIQHDDLFLKHEFNILKDKYIFDYQHKLESSKLIAA